jgi:hypothetical protein
VAAGCERRGERLPVSWTFLLVILTGALACQGTITGLAPGAAAPAATPGAGGAGGYLEPGRFITCKDKPHNHVLVTVANAMGVAIETFGEAGLCDGGSLPESLS